MRHRVTPEAYLSRATLRRDASAASLLPLLRPSESGSQHTGHHLVWSLFADTPDRRRDFLWRETPGGTFYLLSARRPMNNHNLFRLDEPKVFAPALVAGDRLRFSLRANPVVRRTDSCGRSAKHDVVMDTLRRSTDARRETRLKTVRERGAAWLAGQGRGAGFEVDEAELSIDGYQQHRVPRRDGRPMRFSTLDIEGVLRVRDPALFLNAVLRGFGSAKAYGCGLMLIRRA